jgi:hypothetical protein
MARNIQTISIGKIINDSLKLYGSKYSVSPLVAPQDTAYPFVVYKRASIETSYSKDILPMPEKAYVEITVASDTYAEGVTIAEQIRNSMTGITNYENYGLRVENSYLTTASEEYVEGAYLQIMVFCFVCNLPIKDQY